MDLQGRDVKVLETVEDIQDRREQVLDRYAHFKVEARTKRNKLEDSRRFQYFKRDADELESWINEKLQAACDESYKDPTNLQAKIQKHQAFEAEVAAHSNAIVALDNTGIEMINRGHYASDTIKHRLEELHRLWEMLLMRLADKGLKLQQALVLVQFLRQCDEVMFWINDKEAFVTTDEFGQDLEHVEVLQRKFDEFQKDMASQEFRVQEVNEQSDRLINEGHPECEIIFRRKEELNDAWQRLKALTLLRQNKLFGAHEIQRFNRDADETIAWITEKDVVLSSDDYGRDLVSVQTLQRKHEGVERDLAALEDKVMTLGHESERLCNSHEDHADQIRAKHDEIVSNWERLKDKAQERRRRLDESFLLHRFLADFRDLVSWIHDMKSIISADELAKDVAGAEALLERHQEHRGEIDAREDSFKATADAGQSLLNQDHYASDEVKEKLMALASDKQALLALWEERRILYEQCMDLQLFYRDTEQADTWMAKQEAFLANEDLGDSLDSVEALIKKHEDFEKSLAAQEEKIKALDEFATKLIEGQHYAADDVAQRRALLLERREALQEKSHIRRTMLEDSYKLQQFERDCDETKGWISEKLKTAMDESYLDPTNLNGKVQKHQNFEQELNANKSRIEEITSTAQELMESDHYASERIGQRTNEILSLWKTLVDATESKGTKLHEASAQQHFNRGVEDIELWLSEIEGQLMSEDYGKDLTSVQNLLKKQSLLETDVASHQDRIDGVVIQANQFVDRGHFDSEAIKSKQVALVERYNKLHPPMDSRRQRLNDSLRVQQLFRDVEDEEAWMREKEPIAASTNRGRDLIGVQNLIKKHQAVLAEINNHEHRIRAVCQVGEDMIADGHFASEEIHKRMQGLMTDMTRALVSDSDSDSSQDSDDELKECIFEKSPEDEKTVRIQNEMSDSDDGAEASKSTDGKDDEQKACCAKSTANFDSNSTGLFVTKVHGIPSKFNENIALDIKDLLSPTVGNLIYSAQFSHKIDVPWLIEQYPEEFKSLPLLVVHGQMHDSRDALMQSAAPFENISFAQAELPIVYGTHHTKMMFLLYESGLRIVIHTSNLIKQDWYQKTQGMWVSPILPALRGGASAQTGESLTSFKSDLLCYLNAYKCSELDEWCKIIELHNFSSLRVFLVASVPGRYVSTQTTFGHLKLRKVLTNHGPDIEKASTSYIIGQFSSIGSLGADENKWLLKEWLSSLATVKGSSIHAMPLPPLQLVFPTVENIRKSLEGYPTKAILLHGKKVTEKQAYLKNYLHQWKASITGRSKACPHAKTYLRVTNDHKILWFCLTSANLSKAAWGTFELNDEQFMIRSYELGVLFLPQFFGSSDAFSANQPESEQSLLVPFDIPLTAYSQRDEPWMWELPKTSLPDRHGKTLRLK